MKDPLLRFCSRHGGAFLCDQDRASDLWLKEKLDRQLSDFKYSIGFAQFLGRPVNLRVGYTCSQEFNARAGIEDVDDIIAVNVALPLKFRELSKLLISLTEDGEMTFQGPPANGAWTNENVESLLMDVALTKELSDWNRNYALIAIDDIAMRFIFQHEFSHIIYGHTRWLNTTFGVTEMDEMHSYVDGLSPLDKQVLEYQADTTAVHRIMNQVLRIAPYLPEHISRAGPVPYNEYGVKEQAGAAFAMALYILFRTMGMMARESDLDISIYDRDHPPAWLRLQYCITTYMSAYCGEFGAPPDSIAPTLAEGLRVIERRWLQAIGGEPIVERLFDRDSLIAGDIHLGRLMMRSQEIETSLGPHIRGPIPFKHLMM